MIKKLMTMAVLAVTALFMNAQTPLPLNPAVKHGTLPNGLNYYILHNEEPKERANFYIAQKVGSTLETPEQLGLAHFLEHMAFNGTTNYPGKTMLNYLQNKGIRFGSDINAYTSFDETVYRIDNVPTTDKALMDSVLLVLHDWSGSILLEEDEINAERGVIEEEWRSRNDASQRMYETILPQIYQEYQYQQMPIGKMEIVRNFPPEAIRAYYKKWYRPDQQGIVIVGDFDVAEMEQKVIKLFSDIPMPANAAERTYPDVSDNTDPIFVYFKDKELQMPQIQVIFKSDAIPFEMRNTLEAYAQKQLIENLVAMMINNRLEEYQQNPDCKYAYAGVRFGDFLVSKTKDSFNIVIIPKGDNKAAYDDALAIVARACKTGFMQSEVERARDQLIANYEKLYNERNNTKTSSLGNELCRTFIDNEPAPGIEKEYQIMQQLSMMLPVQAYNELASEIMTPNNQVIIVCEPEKEGMAAVVKEDFTTGLQNAINAQYEAYVDEVITDPLIANLPAPGKITSETQGKYDTTDFTLSNGVKVVLKPTDFKADEVLLTAYKEGGYDTYNTTDAPLVLLSGDAYNSSKLGDFDRVKLNKYLAGKVVGLDYQIGSYSTMLNGTSSVKDLKYLMELVYSTFTDVNPDEKAYSAAIDQMRTIFQNYENNPMMIFRNHVSSAQYANNPFFQQPSMKLLDASDYAKELEIVKNSLSNAADYTFVFTGNVDAATLKPLLEQYIATLPSKGTKNAVNRVTNVGYAQGQVKDAYVQTMTDPKSIIFNVMSDSNVPYTIQNDLMVDMFGDILSNVFTETLREEEGGAYSPYAYAVFNPYSGTWALTYVVETNSDVLDKMQTRGYQEFEKLLANGATAEQFGKVKEAAMKQYEINVRTNNYWNSKLVQAQRGYDVIGDHKAAIESITLDSFNEFIKKLYNGKNRIQVVMDGENPAN